MRALIYKTVKAAFALTVLFTSVLLLEGVKNVRDIRS